jgi:hypothetical protein
MAKVLKEYFGAVHCSDAYPYGYGHVRDFLTCPYEDRSFDWVITNPPFRLAMPFILRALPIARRGVAVLARTVFLESAGRYTGIFRQQPPSKFAIATADRGDRPTRLDHRANYGEPGA